MNSIAPSAQPTPDVDTPPITVSLLVRHPSTESGAAKVNTVTGGGAGAAVAGAEVVGAVDGAVTTAGTVVSAGAEPESDVPHAPSATTAADIATVTTARPRITRM